MEKKVQRETTNITKLFTHSVRVVGAFTCSRSVSFEHIKRCVDFLWLTRHTHSREEKKREGKKEKEWEKKSRKSMQLSKSAHTKSIKEIYLSFNMSSADYLTMKWKSELLLESGPHFFPHFSSPRDPDDLSWFYENSRQDREAGTIE